MPTLTRTQIEVYARSAGLPVPLFVDIAMAESSGRTDVVNSIGCVGLWQINQPEHVKDHPTWTREWLKDPANNARAAAVLYAKDNTRPWSSSQSVWGKESSGGDSLIGRVGDALTAPFDVATGTVEAAVETARGVARIATALERAGTWITTPANVVRVVYVAGGSLLVLVAVNQVVTVPAVAPVVRVIAGTTGRAGGRSPKPAPEGG